MSSIQRVCSTAFKSTEIMTAFYGSLLFNYEMENEVYNKLGDLYSQCS